MNIGSGGAASLMKHGSVKTLNGGRPQSNRRNFLFYNCCYFGRRDGLRFLPNFAPGCWSSFDRARKKEDVRLTCSRLFRGNPAIAPVLTSTFKSQESIRSKNTHTNTRPVIINSTFEILLVPISPVNTAQLIHHMQKPCISSSLSASIL